MSHIVFADVDTEIRISGQERGWIGQYLMQIPLAIFPPENTWTGDGYTKLVTPGHYLERFVGTPEFARVARTSWTVGASGGFTVNPLDISLNTATAIGSPELAVMAWIHGQCEVHGFIEGQHRAWLAARLERALQVGLIRPQPFQYDGWPRVIEWLRADRWRPVVMSYSITECFPEAPADVDEDTWFARAHWERWVDGLMRLRQCEGNVGALDPDTLADRRYGDGQTIFDLMDERVARG